MAAVPGGLTCLFIWIYLFFQTYLVLVTSKTADPDLARVRLFYDELDLKSELFKFSEYYEMVGSEHFSHNITTCFIPDYIEPQLYNSTYNAQAYVELGEINFIMIDWGLPLVDDESKVLKIDEDAMVNKITEWLLNLLDHHLKRSHFHILAYAKGVNMAAKVAEKLVDQKKLHRITALAPPLNTPLDKSRVTFIDAIYTDQGEYGTDRDVGHANFRPNGGNAPQAACKDSEIDICSRQFSYLLWAESVEDAYSTQFCAYEAETFDDFKKKKDENKLGDPVFMGHNLDISNAHGRYFLETNDKYPYAKGC